MTLIMIYSMAVCRIDVSMQRGCTAISNSPFLLEEVLLLLQFDYSLSWVSIIHSQSLASFQTALVMNFAVDYHLVSPLAPSNCSLNYFAQNTQRGPDPLG